MNPQRSTVRKHTRQHLSGLMRTFPHHPRNGKQMGETKRMQKKKKYNGRSRQTPKCTYCLAMYCSLCSNSNPLAKQPINHYSQYAFPCRSTTTTTTTMTSEEHQIPTTDQMRVRDIYNKYNNSNNKYEAHKTRLPI